MKLTYADFLSVNILTYIITHNNLVNLHVEDYKSDKMAGKKAKVKSTEEHLELIVSKLDIMEEQMKELKADNQNVREQLGVIQDDNKRLEQKMNNIMKDNKALVSRVSSVEKELKQKSQDITCLNEKVSVLENKLAEQEQYSKRDNILIQGLKIAKPYSRVAEDNNQQVVDDGDKWSDSDKLIMRSNIMDFSKNKLKVNIENSDILDVHVLPNRGHNNKGTVIVRFTNRLARDRFYQARLGQKKHLFDEKIYLNEHLTARNASLFKKARELRKDQKITHAWTKNCRLFVRLLNNEVKQVTGDDFFNDFE